MALVHRTVRRSTPPRAHLNGCQGLAGASSARAIARRAQSRRSLFQLCKKSGKERQNQRPGWGWRRKVQEFSLEVESQGFCGERATTSKGQGRGKILLACRQRWSGLLAERSAQVLLSRNSQGQDSGLRMQPGSKLNRGSFVSVGSKGEGDVSCWAALGSPCSSPVGPKGLWGHRKQPVPHSATSTREKSSVISEKGRLPR